MAETLEVSQLNFAFAEPVSKGALIVPGEQEQALEMLSQKGRFNLLSRVKTRFVQAFFATIKHSNILNKKFGVVGAQDVKNLPDKGLEALIHYMYRESRMTLIKKILGWMIPILAFNAGLISRAVMDDDYEWLALLAFNIFPLFFMPMHVLDGTELEFCWAYKLLKREMKDKLPLEEIRARK